MFFYVDQSFLAIRGMFSPPKPSPFSNNPAAGRSVAGRALSPKSAIDGHAAPPSDHTRGLRQCPPAGMRQNAAESAALFLNSAAKY